MKIICVENNCKESCSNNIGVARGADGAAWPSFFMKPDTALLRNNEDFYVPSFAEDFRCSLNLVVKSNRVAKAIKPRFVERCFDQVGLAVNFEAADAIERCNALNISCDAARAFDHSTAMSPEFVDVEQLENLAQACFQLKINDQIISSATLQDLFFGVDAVVSFVSDFVTLKIGDLILMGSATQAVGVSRGDKVEASLGGRILLNFEIR